MGVFIEPDILQGQMSALMDVIDFVRVYLNYFLFITFVSFEDHLAKVENIMNQPQLAGIKFKINKCKFPVPKI